MVNWASMKKDELTFRDIFRARQIIREHLPPTNFLHSLLLSQLLGTEVYLKYENQSPIGSFKARGALACLSSLARDWTSKGVITASTGNHGQGLALAGSLLKVQVQVYVPKETSPGKLAMIRALGASIVSVGNDLDDCKEFAKREARKQKKYFVEDGNEVSICAGTATIALEMIETHPEIDTIFVPVGNGALINGIGFFAKNANPKTTVIGVQSEGAPSMYLSWKRRRPVKIKRMRTFAEGISTRVPTRLSLRMMKETVDDMLLVSDEELEQAIYLLLEKTRNLVEGAGATSLAGALKVKDSLKGKRVALILSGGNLEEGRLGKILSTYGGSSAY